VRNRVKLSMKK
jgi:hypothetical protein